ncbi:hypothetical protein RJ639_035579 [Escallonia herrerae]|uniref:Uncharacterized protein n=1 Tax=Escallonia herrerae TaxID=1293975 RepID=A0AA88WRB1_9ASTE|nr:hypothetical protein RJ639_035579 [Escallonia herrerae]
MAGPSREQALSLLAAANNHGDLAVKLSSLKQAKDILLVVEPSVAGELFPYLVELQSSPESLVRKALIELIDEIGLQAMEHSVMLIPVLLSLLKDDDFVVARKSVISGTHMFCSVLEELTLQRSTSHRPFLRPPHVSLTQRFAPQIGGRSTSTQPSTVSAHLCLSLHV